MDSLKRNARKAGWLYLLLAITSIFGLVYVPSKTIVAGDTLATIQNIMDSPLLFRLGIVSNLIYLVIFVLLVLAFYNLFTEVNKAMAMVMVILVLVAIPIAFVNELNKFAVLILLGREGSLHALEQPQLQAMVQLFLSLYKQLSNTVMMFWGIWLLPLGLLVLQSGFMPRFIGYLLIIGCIGYVASSFTYMFSPELGKMVFKIGTIPSALAEFTLIFWLLIKGMRK